MSSSPPPSRQKTSEQGLAIQQEVDSKEAQKPSSSPEHTAMQAGIREYPTEFVAQHHPSPGESGKYVQRPCMMRRDTKDRTSSSTRSRSLRWR
jgi:hypothetical protein